ncbi:5'/3'-nucleotidase SurE [Caminicella sporogenes]|uniref:5'/3'-nucleotidase SurE n=1 Tax=Caminicella sporogenes TaxID=166485 RepID=UPI00254000AE|nr:5'/3'-nucleotidase SurE [Caminicella sporogenes]WIF94723.1 5'/3'-nucleotidase SurE [Caminicella sporogenes]
MKVLVTNDDGIFAEGIYKLAKKLSEKFDVYVVAPDRQRSATGHAITMHHPLRVNKVKFFDTDILAWAVNGTPTDCVKLGIEAILDIKPDIIISGINDGPNLGTDVLYSGTVSAAIEGAIHGFKSLAISMVSKKDIDYDFGADFSLKIAEKLLEKELPNNTLLNINIPDCSRQEVKGIKVTTLGIRRYKNSFIKRIDPRGQEYYWLGGEIVKEIQNETSDIACVEDNYISITPIHFDLTKFEAIEEIKKWDLKSI